MVSRRPSNNLAQFPSSLQHNVCLFLCNSCLTTITCVCVCPDFVLQPLRFLYKLASKYVSYTNCFKICFMRPNCPRNMFHLQTVLKSVSDPNWWCAVSAPNWYQHHVSRRPPTLKYAPYANCRGGRRFIYNTVLKYVSYTNWCKICFIYKLL